ncbi:MAG: response regulator [Proteobacteria bacterium]|nr:response regulator [Pseudomonadota bacterium]
MATHHILLVESKPNLQHSLSLMLKQEDYRVSLADTKEEALAVARVLASNSEGVDLMIVDLDSTTHEACQTFMHALSASGLNIPYLILAEEIEDQSIDAFKNHGCLACITKPFEPAALFRSVHEALDCLSPQDGHQRGRKQVKSNTESAMNG